MVRKVESGMEENTTKEFTNENEETQEEFERIHPDDVEVVDEKKDEEDITSAEMAAKLKDDLKKAVSMATKSASKNFSKFSKEAEKTAKDVAKTASEKAVKVKEETVKVAKETVEKVKEKIDSDCRTEVFVQYQGREVKEEVLIDRIKEQYKAEGHDGAINSIKLYIKLEDGCVYYVINDESAGQINL